MPIGRSHGRRVAAHEDISTVARFVRTIFTTLDPSMVARVSKGVSTAVYRIQTAEGTYYLRIWPAPGESFAPEVTLHHRLRALGLHVPDVVHFEHHSTQFQRSAMITTAIAGRAIGYSHQPATVRQILFHAGRELATINQVAVQGYGWMDRNEPSLGTLRAEYPTLATWLMQHFEGPIRALARCRHVVPHASEVLLTLLTEACRIFADDAAVVAHGDFDVTHIYYDNGSYAGVIDFGEIRGAHRFYDLGHFAIENNEVLPYLLEGYATISPLSGDDVRRMQLTGLLIAAQRIGRRVLGQREADRPDVEFVARMLPTFT